MMNLSVLNKLALPFLKMYPEKMSIKRKMMAAAMNDQVLHPIIKRGFYLLFLMRLPCVYRNKLIVDWFR